MNITIIADASTNIGSGHVMRCLTLAKALKSPGGIIEFICAQQPGDMISYIEKQGFTVHTLDNRSDREPQVINHLSEKIDKLNWIIIDHYDYTDQEERKFRPFTKKIMIIDDLANRKHDCDLLLDQNYSKNLKRYNHLVSQHCSKLLGPDYALLRSEFKEKHSKVKHRTGKVNSILVFLGGGDSENITEKVLDALIFVNNQNLKIDVVIGSSNPNRNKLEEKIKCLPRAELSIQVSDMAERMVNADLFIGAGGATTWERMCLALPSIVLIIAENQKPTVEDLALDDLIINLGWHADVTTDDIGNSIKNILDDTQKIQSISKRNSNLVDGAGVERVVVQMHDLLQ